MTDNEQVIIRLEQAAGPSMQFYTFKWLA